MACNCLFFLIQELKRHFGYISFNACSNVVWPSLMLLRRIRSIKKAYGEYEKESKSPSANCDKWKWEWQWRILFLLPLALLSLQFPLLWKQNLMIVCCCFLVSGPGDPNQFSNHMANNSRNSTRNFLKIRIWRWDFPNIYEFHAFERSLLFRRDFIHLYFGDLIF